MDESISTGKSTESDHFNIKIMEEKVKKIKSWIDLINVIKPTIKDLPINIREHFDEMENYFKKRIPENDEVICPMSIKDFKEWQTSSSIIKSLRDENEKLKSSQYFENIVAMVVQNNELKKQLNVEKSKRLIRLFYDHLTKRIKKIFKVKDSMQ